LARAWAAQALNNGDLAAACVFSIFRLIRSFGGQAADLWEESSSTKTGAIKGRCLFLFKDQV
jgi:hypothetical protein